MAKEGEKCDIFCICEQGLLCAPNVLCRTCGNICMSTYVVNKLIEYYDSGCNCAPTYFGPPPHHQNYNQKKQFSSYKVYNRIVKFPGTY